SFPDFPYASITLLSHHVNDTSSFLAKTRSNISSNKLILPLLRRKRFALVAAMCILAIIVQIAFYLHIQTHVFRIPVMFTRPVVFPTAFMSFFSVVCHVLLATTLWTRAKSVDLSSKTEITSCYMFIWKLFYAEYLLLSFFEVNIRREEGRSHYYPYVYLFRQDHEIR
uniref:Uncharacterized protein n=1 Tax=Brassica oleracea var. oleracea TaxID=109376 RepID=A0A0D3E3F1_BRAOL